MPKVSPFTQAMLDIFEDFRSLQEVTSKAKVIPLGQEQLTRKEMKERLTSMSPAQRQKLLTDPKRRQEIIEVLRGNNSRLSNSDFQSSRSLDPI